MKGSPVRVRASALGGLGRAEVRRDRDLAAIVDPGSERWRGGIDRCVVTAVQEDACCLIAGSR